MRPTPTETSPLVPLTRKEFYELAEHCRAYALELARHDQGRVSLKHCYQFNEWLPGIKAYDLMAPALRDLKPARPIARWQVMTLSALLGLVLLFVLTGRLSPFARTLFPYAFVFLLIFVYLIPERLYGTTIEHLEAKVLRVVETMEKLLLDGSMDFTEAAFFQVKENLAAARTELRQQIDLSHRARSRSIFG